MLLYLVFVTLFIVSIFVIDDLFIDLVAFVKGLRPKKLTPEILQQWNEKREKHIAIMVANWHEADVIGRMVSGNNRRINYKNFHFFIGVYPNDLPTVVAAQNVATVFKNVHVIENPLPGPTSKGQMLNEIARGIFRLEPELGIEFDIFVMHDSEDILHPLSLKMINSESERAEFLQIPVFSFERKFKDWIGSTYIDEFAEIHTKDMFVREALGAPLPSAGVGTALHRKLMITLMTEEKGFIREDSLTEDYVLGMSSALKGFRTSFSCYYQKTENGRDFIATREYFPNRLQASIRQKTRWILGIVFQGRKIVPWDGQLVHKYFLYRDRRGPINNFVAMMTTALTIYLFSYPLLNGESPRFMQENWFYTGSLIATIGAFSRLYHRMKAVVWVNGWKKVILVPFRWPLGNFINFVASVRAFREYRRAKVTKQPLKWVKTTHELPDDFGHDPA